MTLPHTAWAERGDELAAWAWTRLVNRLDAWGGYRPPEEWEQEFQRSDGTRGKLGRTTTHKGKLSRDVLARHFWGRSRADLIGLHSTNPFNQSLWGALDIDWHGPTSTAPDVNLGAALAWHDRLVREGFHPMLVDSNGVGGYHLWILFAGPAPTPRVYHFLKQVVRDHTNHDMASPPEQFPKQAALRPTKDGKPGFGNWLRVLGRHHSREHWSRVWNGSRWLEWHQAIDFVLTLQGDPPNLLPDVPPSTPLTPARPRPWTPTPCRDDRAARAAAYMRRLPNLGEGQGRDDVAYQFAAFLLRDLGLDDHVALDWLGLWDAGNRPPKGNERLLEIMASVRLYGRHPIASDLGAVSIRPRGGHHVTISFEMEVH